MVKRCLMLCALLQVLKFGGSPPNLLSIAVEKVNLLITFWGK